MNNFLAGLFCCSAENRLFEKVMPEGRKHNPTS